MHQLVTCSKNMAPHSNKDLRVLASSSGHFSISHVLTTCSIFNFTGCAANMFTIKSGCVHLKDHGHYISLRTNLHMKYLTFVL